MTYAYTKNGSSLIKFMSSDYTSYTFELFQKVFSANEKFDSELSHYPMKLTVDGPNKNENTVYKDIKKVVPFVSVDYKKSFQIFDFIKEDDQLLGSIKSIKRFNSMTDDFQAVFNGVKIVHEIKYENFYKKIYNRSKLNSDTLTSLFFDDELNILTLYTVILDFSPQSFIEINFTDADNKYYVFEKKEFLTKDELFQYIKSVRRHFIQRRIKQLFKNLEFEIDFDNKYQEQIQLLEMLVI